MNSWQILGIEPTGDEALIRRAYARQLKTCRPDSDPDGYQRLREAFEWAKSSASALQPDETDDAPERALAVEKDAVHRPEDIAAAEPNAGASPPARYDAEPCQETAAAEPDAEASIFPGYVAEPGLEAVAAFPPSLAPIYTPEEMQALAAELVNEGNGKLTALDALFQRVSHEGNLMQQQQFHQNLAAALAEQPGLSEWLVEKISDALQWELDQYSSGYLVPEALQEALNAQIRATGRERAWHEMKNESQHGDFSTRLALGLLCGDRAAAPLWARLVPGLIAKMAQQVNTLYATFPELVQRLNPAMLEFISARRCALSWQGLFLLAFWGAIFPLALSGSPPGLPIGPIAFALVVYFLYLSDAILMGLRRRPWLMGIFILLDCLVSVALLAALLVGVLVLTISHSAAKGEGFSGMTPLFIVLIEWLILWSVWSKQAPGLRRPGIAVARLLSSPWRLLATLEFSVVSYPLIAVYAIFCCLLLDALLNLAAGLYG
ncbi:MAG: hypothetical protein E7C36_10265 [Mixta calida]|uniref:J domain-containing protein n=1 Tax=Mixta calida TaxID=665913 RepID=UPI0005360753|nr:J domain-containing protein [Mixta calida]AIX74626.1 hypothetical protein PSNIH2_13155 [Pantoea sp. PSNIH2]MBS6056686.1 J domain-containing protein [Pantoea sp.]MDU2733658.1 hypothetical protein [Mixta calida]MDU4289909.1 hypothetical protein [Mixta calida]MDU5190507.1 hypothetical protein [Mixta calida]